MNNKKLEQKLIKEGYSVWVRVLEICEKDKNISSIKVDKKQKFTDSVLLNKMIITYLKKLNIKIIYVDMTKESKKLHKKQKDEISKKKAPCKNAVHLPFQKPINKDEKKEIYKSYKYPLFSIDNKCYVTCPECYEIIEIKD